MKGLPSTGNVCFHCGAPTRGETQTKELDVLLGFNFSSAHDQHVGSSETPLLKFVPLDFQRLIFGMGDDIINHVLKICLCGGDQDEVVSPSLVG